jgi:hypothetical protein
MLNKPGLIVKLVAQKSSYVVDIPNYTEVCEWLEPGARVEFVAGDRNRIIGYRTETTPGEPSWHFVVVLTRESLALVRDFAESIDPNELEWTSPLGTLEICSDQLEPLPPRIEYGDVSFVGAVTSMKAGQDGTES